MHIAPADHPRPRTMAIRNPPPDPSRHDRWFLVVQALLGSGLLVAFVRAPPSAAGPRAAAAAALLALALLVGLTALVQLRHSFRVAPSPRPDGALEVRGIYRWLRHPMYAAVILGAAAAIVARPDPLVAAAGALNYAFYVIKSRHEERLLRARYPPYADYCRRTIGIWP